MGVSTGCVSMGGVSDRLSTYLVVLAVVVCSWDASCVHCEKVIVRIAGSFRRVGGVDGYLTHHSS